MGHHRQTQRGPYAGGPQFGPGASGPQGYAPNGAGQYAYGPQPGAPPERRIDALDVLEGVLTNGLNLSSLTRIARASGSNFWIGAAIGAGLVVMAHRSEVGSVIANAFTKAKAAADAKVGDAVKTPGE
jgi:hypothetical protein